MKIDLIVSDNMAYVQYLFESGIVRPDAEVAQFVTGVAVIGRHVIGELPHHLSCMALSYTEVPLCLPPELIGRRLIFDDYVKYARAPVTYNVSAKRVWRQRK